jgi:flagellar hook assembly protein FlgD
MSIRARMQHQASGKTYWDDFAVAEGNITRVNGQEVKTVPVVFNLVQNYPNPFNPVTTVEFSLPNDDQVNLAIYDLLGKRIRTLIDGKYSAGEHKVVWDATDESGKSVSSGTYFYVLTTKNARMTRKMTLLK